MRNTSSSDTSFPCRAFVSECVGEHDKMYLVNYTFDLFAQLRTGPNLGPAIILETHIEVRFPSSIAVGSMSRNLARRQIDRVSP